MANTVRLRAHIEPQQTESGDPPANLRRRSSEQELAKRRALFISTIADNKDRPIATLFREWLDGWTVEEGITIHHDVAAESAMEWAALQRPDLAPGMVAEFRVLTSYQLSRKIISRCYQRCVPLVGWDLAWQLGCLAGHVGRSVGGSFSICLLGCGKEVNGKWKESKYRPRIRIVARGSGQAGAFIRWLAPFDEASRAKGHGQRFVELTSLSSTVCGGEISSPKQAAELLDIDWPGNSHGF
jgi:hypothetical protein